MAVALPVLGVWILGIPLSAILLVALFRHMESYYLQLTPTRQA